ncbi:uncharacterized protein MYCFIDRAFT_119914, partial [Pseudocercospora fijiensis CIRAD86]
LKTRLISPIFSTLTPDPSYRLQTTLADFLPHDSNPPPLTLPHPQKPWDLPPAHHLLYFEPTKRSSEMLPDGTNPDHFPGEPFVKRMWAGGKVLYDNAKPLRLDGGVGVCGEFVRDVKMKGKEEEEGKQKVFVEIERRIARASPEEILGVRQRLWRDGEEEFGPCKILERRVIVFMRNKKTNTRTKEGEGGKVLKSEYSSSPDFTHTLIPTPSLLFRFSALTFNSHAIHLDPSYTKNIEGHPKLLVQGPLSLTFLITLLSRHLAKEGGNQVMQSIEYRNLAALYCGEEVRFCGKEIGEKKWEVWAEDEQGGVAVRGRVRT